MRNMQYPLFLVPITHEFCIPCKYRLALVFQRVLEYREYREGSRSARHERWPSGDGSASRQLQLRLDIGGLLAAAGEAVTVDWLADHSGAPAADIQHDVLNTWFGWT